MFTRGAPVAVFAMLLGARLAFAADPGDFAIVGLRLGMTPEETGDGLARQSRDIELQRGPCPAAKDRTCVLAISARMPDGRLTVQFRDSASGPGDARAWRIALTVRGRGEADRDMVRQAAVAHYGPPVLEGPAWCRLDDAGQTCRAGGPSLVFKPVPGGAGELVLAEPDG